MADTQSQNPIGTENTEIQSNSEKVNQLLFDSMLGDLEMMEWQIFNGDGKLGGESNDSPIDKEYDIAMKDATDIKTKLKIIEKLSNYFRLWSLAINSMTESHKDSKYIDNEWKKSIDIFNKEYQKLLIRNPLYNNAINTYFKVDLDSMNSGIRFNESEFTKTKDLKYLDKIKDNLNNYKVYLTTDIPILEKNIEWLSKIPQIKNKDKCLQYIINNDFYWLSETDGDLWPTLQKLFSIDFIAQWFSDDEKDDNDEKTFKYGTLSVLMDIWMEEVNKINKLYKDPNKKEELVKLLESFPLNERNRLLEIKVFKDISLDLKKNMSWWDIDFSKLDFTNQNINDVFINTSNLSQDFDHTNIFKWISKIFNSWKPAEDCEKFLSQWWEFDVLMKSYKNLSDKFYLCKIFQSIASYIWSERIIWNENSNFYETTSAVLKYKKMEIIKGVELEINEQRKILEWEKLLEFERKLKVIMWDSYNVWKIDFNTIIADEQSKSNKSNIWNLEKDSGNEWNIVSLFQIIWSTTKPFIGPPEPKPQEKQPEKPQQTISESKRQEMQENLKKVWFNVTVGDKWELIWVNWEKTFKQKVWNRTLETDKEWKILDHWAMWYVFKYDNNENWINKFLEISEEITYVDELWFWHFWNNFKDMVNTLNELTNVTWLKKININDNELNSTNFMNQVELNTVTKAFFKLWFLDNEVYSYWFKTEPITKTTFDTKMNTEFKWKNFFKWDIFSSDEFKSNIRNTKWK